MRLKHRGPDSTGYAVYGEPKDGDYVMRIESGRSRRTCTADAASIRSSRTERIAEVERKSSDEQGAKVKDPRRCRRPNTRCATSSATMATPPRWHEHIEETEGVEILSMGNGLELIKDLGDAADRRGPLWPQNDFRKAPTPSATPAWRPSPTSIFVRPTPTGHSPTTTSPSCITARSPTTGSCAARWSEKGHRFMSNCD